jgi:purine nucleoside phosphorylase
MTGMPEARSPASSLLPYAAIAVVVNHAAGRGDSSQESR